MSCDFLEMLSEYVDGELAPPQRARMEDHLAVCSACRASLRILSGVGDALAPPPPDFAARTAARVLAAPPPVSLLSRLFAGDNPVAAMLRSRNSRRGLATVPWKAVLLLFALPTLGFFFNSAVLGGSDDGLTAFPLFAALGLLVGLPAWFLRSDVALLSSLHRGRCLEEILTANVSPATIVDTLATHSVRAILRAALPVAFVLVLGALPLAQWRLAAPGLVCMWLVGLVVTFFTLAYVMQAAATAGSMTCSRLGYLLLFLAWIPFLMSFGGWNWLRIPGWLFLVFALRKAAIEGLRRSLLVRSTGQKPLRWRLVGAWTDNGIVVRETRRRSLFDWTLASVIFIPFGYLIILFGLRDSGWTHQFMVDTGWAAWWILALVSFFAAAARTVGAVVGEKERRTWEPLVEAGFPRGEFVSGWLQLGILPVAVAQLPVYVLLTLWEGSLGGVTGLGWLVLAGWLMGLVVTWAGAALGLALSALSATSREAGTRVVACGAGLVTVWLVCNGALFLVALAGAEFRWWNAGSSRWAEVVKYWLPAAALLLTSGLSLLVSRRVLRSELQLGRRGPGLGSGLPALGRWAAWLGAPAVATWFALCVDGGQGGMGAAALAVSLSLLAVSGPVMALTRCAGSSLQGAALGFAAGSLLAGCSLGLHHLLTPYAVLAVFLVSGKAYAFGGGHIYEMLLLAPAVGTVVGMRMLSRSGTSWGEGRRVAARRALPVLVLGGALLALGSLAVERARKVRLSDPALVQRLVKEWQSVQQMRDFQEFGAYRDYFGMEARLPGLRRLLARPTTRGFGPLRDGLRSLAVWQGLARPRAAALTWRTYVQVWSRSATLFVADELDLQVLEFVRQADLAESDWSEWLSEFRELELGPRDFGRLMDHRFAYEYQRLLEEQPYRSLANLPRWYLDTMATRFANQYLEARPRVYRLQSVSQPGELLGLLSPSAGRPYPDGQAMDQLAQRWSEMLLGVEKLRVAIEMRRFEKRHGRLPRDGNELPLTRSPWMPDNTTIVLNSQGVTALTDTGPLTLYSFKVPARDE